ncbi:RNA polymerase sigma factor [Plebeiibacterium marinum]|uniref:Sigma-70 family RNA polymerase sigma factor n=1 Tax=Plebeiibacterium marinum TaxID=2992111 RepID=A0AAE3MCC6_9BACT|nr:sigma-70 family RNA polymerase sigma factor [Plebeiobacterium marinum]MCW3804964.1 sigma-70 family RNA polymerase sigma factor [Plebeiobacterium marinum]
MKTINVDIHKSIIEKAKKGNYKAQKKLYELYAKAMFNICYRMMNNIPEAEDLLQESFCDAFRRLDSFRYESTFGAWLKRIVINRCINELKRKKIELEYSDKVFKMEVYEENAETDIQPNIEKIKKAMGLLPEGYRIVFSLYLIEGYDHQEIADILGISESTSKSQLARAKKKVVEIINAGSFEYSIN